MLCRVNDSMKLSLAVTWKIEGTSEPMKWAEASQVAYRTRLLPVNDKIQEDKDESDKELFFFLFLSRT